MEIEMAKLRRFRNRHLAFFYRPLVSSHRVWPYFLARGDAFFARGGTFFFVAMLFSSVANLFRPWRCFGASWRYFFARGVALRVRERLSLVRGDAFWRMANFGARAWGFDSHCGDFLKRIYCRVLLPHLFP
jgi:hypothetical protein